MTYLIVKNIEIFQNDLIVTSDLFSYEIFKIFQNDLIIMGDLPSCQKFKDFS